MFHTQHGPPPQTIPSAQPSKRPAPASEVPTLQNREIQPRAQGFATVNEPMETTAYPSSLADPGEHPRKKRGRPSKAEAGIRAAEYAARGEPYPLPRKPKTPKSSDTPGKTPIMFTPVTMGQSETPGGTSSRKRAAKSRTKRTGTNPGVEEAIITTSSNVQDPENTAMPFKPTVHSPEREDARNLPVASQPLAPQETTHPQPKDQGREPLPQREEVMPNYDVPSQLVSEHSAVSETQPSGKSLVPPKQPQQQSQPEDEQKSSNNNE
ncbi:MAG: hypothetical protein Q9167_002687 [Letrouitia subvulpina]